MNDANDLELFIMNVRNTKNLSENTIKAYRSDINGFFQQYVPSTENQVINYIDHLKNNIGLKDSSIKRKIVTLKLYCNFLQEEGRLESNPFERYKFSFRQERRLPKTLTVSEVKSLLNEIDNALVSSKTRFSLFEETRNAALLDILISTGIRVGEASSILLGDIFQYNHSILIRGKGKRQRIVYVSCQETWTRLRNWIKVRGMRDNGCPNVFINKNGDKMSVHSIEAVYYKYRDRAGINPYSTPHYLRHTFATNLLSNGADLRSVQEILGHQSVSTTEIYTEINDKRKKQVFSKFNYRNKI